MIPGGGVVEKILSLYCSSLLPTIMRAALTTHHSHFYNNKSGILIRNPQEDTL
ncbi:Uncharacterized protein DAT39_006080, partial [Clarias magur]